MTSVYYTGLPKKLAQLFLYALTLPNNYWFSKLFRCQNRVKIYNKDPTTPHLCCYTTLWNVKCLKSNNKKQDLCSNTFKEINDRKQRVVSVIVQSNCHMLQFLHQMFSVSALLLDDALLKCVVTEVVLFSIVAFKTLDISQGSVATQWRCGEIFSYPIITNFLLILRVK